MSTKIFVVEMHATVTSRQNIFELCFGSISTIAMLFGQPHVTTNDLIHKCINYMYDQIAIACKVLFSWNDVIEKKKLKSINKDTKSMLFLSCKSRAFNQNNSIIFLRKIVSSMCGQLISLCI